jgi:hypothetical protein
MDFANYARSDIKSEKIPKIPQSWKQRKIQLQKKLLLWGGVLYSSGECTGLVKYTKLANIVHQAKSLQSLLELDIRCRQTMRNKKALAWGLRYKK